MFDLRAGEAGLTFRMELHPGLPEYVEADSGKLRQILINLLGNAVKFTRRGGVTLRASARPAAEDDENKWLRIEVQDSGPGVPKGRQQQIFQPFVQAGHSAAAKGTGLGLSITRSFVDLMGGAIELESEPGRGTLFRVELPVRSTGLSAPPPAVDELAEVIGLEPNQPAPRVLVVEDNPESRLLLRGYFEPMGFLVREAANGAEGLSLFEQWHPHFVWMDMRMPVMDGFETTRRIRELPGGEGVKIVALTANVLKEEQAGILAAGCDAVLHKPFRAADLFQTMGRLLELRYRYADTPDRSHARQPPSSLTPTMLEQLPEELRLALREAAWRLDVDAAQAQIDRIRAVNGEIAEGLEAFLESFQFQRILELLGETPAC